MQLRTIRIIILAGSGTPDQPHVYICICNGYRERELRDAVLSGARTVKEAYQSLGNGPCCGCCVDDAQDFIEETLATTACAAE